MLEGPQGASSTIQRAQGFLDVIASYQKMKVISNRANYLRNDAIKLMEELYKEGVQTVVDIINGKNVPKNIILDSQYSN